MNIERHGIMSLCLIYSYSWKLLVRTGVLIKAVYEWNKQSWGGWQYEVYHQDKVRLLRGNETPDILMFLSPPAHFTQSRRAPTPSSLPTSLPQAPSLHHNSTAPVHLKYQHTPMPTGFHYDFTNTAAA